VSLRIIQLAAPLFLAICVLSVLPQNVLAKKQQSAKPAAQELVQQTLQDGIYKVAFSAPDGQNGIGIIVISGRTVNGGDPAYTYQGRIESEGGTLKAIIDIVRHNRELESIFGPLDKFQLQLNGTLQKNGKAFSASGAVASQPKLHLTLSGEQLRELR